MHGYSASKASVFTSVKKLPVRYLRYARACKYANVCASACACDVSDRTCVRACVSVRCVGARRHVCVYGASCIQRARARRVKTARAHSCART